MSQFKLYLQLGMEHIIDISGYDHILFVVALTSIYILNDWKRILILITALAPALTAALCILSNAESMTHSQASMSVLLKALVF